LITCVAMTHRAPRTTTGWLPCLVRGRVSRSDFTPTPATIEADDNFRWKDLPPAPAKKRMRSGRRYATRSTATLRIRDPALHIRPTLHPMLRLLKPDAQAGRLRCFSPEFIISDEPTTPGHILGSTSLALDGYGKMERKTIVVFFPAIIGRVTGR